MTDEAPEQPERLELLGTAEVAALLGIAKSSLADRRRMPIFPKPIAELAWGAIWTRAQIDEYRRRWVRGKHGSTYIWAEEWGRDLRYRPLGRGSRERISIPGPRTPRRHRPVAPVSRACWR